MGIIGPEGVLMLPEGREARGQHQHSRGANNTHEAQGRGVIITFLFSRADFRNFLTITGLKIGISEVIQHWVIYW